MASDGQKLKAGSSNSATFSCRARYKSHSNNPHTPVHGYNTEHACTEVYAANSPHMYAQGQCLKVQRVLT